MVGLGCGGSGLEAPGFPNLGVTKLWATPILMINHGHSELFGVELMVLPTMQTIATARPWQLERPMGSTIGS